MNKIILQLKDSSLRVGNQQDPRAPPKDMGKMMGILQLCSPTAQERHVDKRRPLNKYNTTPHPVIPQSRGERNEIRLHFEVVHLTGGCWMSSDVKIHRKDGKGGRKAYSPA